MSLSNAKCRNCRTRVNYTNRGQVGQLGRDTLCRDCLRERYLARQAAKAPVSPDVVYPSVAPNKDVGTGPLFVIGIIVVVVVLWSVLR